MGKDPRGTPLADAAAPPPPSPEICRYALKLPWQLRRISPTRRPDLLLDFAGHAKNLAQDFIQPARPWGAAPILF